MKPHRFNFRFYEVRHQNISGNTAKLYGHRLCWSKVPKRNTDHLPNIRSLFHVLICKFIEYKSNLMFSKLVYCTFCLCQWVYSLSDKVVVREHQVTRRWLEVFSLSRVDAEMLSIKFDIDNSLEILKVFIAPTLRWPRWFQGPKRRFKLQ